MFDDFFFLVGDDSVLLRKLKVKTKTAIFV